MLFLFIFSYKKYLSRNLPLSKITIILCQKNSQTLVDYGDDKNNEIEARFLKIREMPWILSTLPPITTLSSFNNFLQRARGRSEKIKTSTRRHPSPSLRSEIFPSGRFSTTVRRQPLLGIETPEEFIYSK